MARILVKTPVTYNGRDPIMEGGQQVYKETILEAAAGPILEKINTKLPPHLKKIITPIKDGETIKEAPKTKAKKSED